MASPLKPYINARILVPVEGSISLVNGRFVAAGGTAGLVKCFIKRAQYTGVSSGSRKIPLESQLDGRMLPGASGDQFYYRGYALEYAIVAESWDIEQGDESALTFLPVTAQYEWMQTGKEVQFRFGNDPIMPAAQIEVSSGIFGGEGIDEIIYKEIGGVQLQITGTQLQN